MKAALNITATVGADSSPTPTEKVANNFTPTTSRYG
jgi:hypothetical protein